MQIIRPKPDLLSTIMKILGREHSFMLFKLCDEGIVDTTKPEALGLTRKQYYTKLLQLKNTDLIVKSRLGIYEHTTLGRLVFAKLKELDGLEDKQKTLMMIDTLKHSGQFNTDDIDGFISKVNGESKEQEKEK